jgi:hypothetical protein
MFGAAGVIRLQRHQPDKPRTVENSAPSTTLCGHIFARLNFERCSYTNRTQFCAIPYDWQGTAGMFEVALFIIVGAAIAFLMGAELKGELCLNLEGAPPRVVTRKAVTVRTV